LSNSNDAPKTDDMADLPGFLCVDHVAVAVKAGELESQVNGYKLLGFTEIHREDVLGGDQVREVLLRIGNGPNLIQLLEPLRPDSPVQKLMEKNGGRGGFAHLAFRVEDIHRAFSYLKEHGFHIIDKEPRKGSRGTTVFFLHPKSREQAPFGFLIEIVQEG
jgi:methylmalonyl-CoA/ethylmalonyl-CoA epimerase